MNSDDFEPRDLFATVALNGLLAGDVMPGQVGIREHAEAAYAFADAMLEARKRPRD